MKSLSVFALAEDDHLIQPEEFQDVKASTPALAILTDFRNHKPPMVDSHLEASEAMEMMLAEGVAIKLVVNDAREFIGVINREHLSEHHLLCKQAELRLKRDELLVRDLMLPRHQIRAIGYEQFKRASVGDIVSTLKKSHQEYLLVVDTDEHHIRGIVSAHDIASRLHTPVEIEKELTFIDIFSAVTAH